MNLVKTELYVLDQPCRVLSLAEINLVAGGEEGDPGNGGPGGWNG